MSKFIGTLCCGLVQDEEKEQWKLLAPFSFESDLAGCIITADKDFHTDFCSVPRVPGVYLILGNRARKSGAIHDWLYTTHQFSRRKSDEILKEMLSVNGLNELEAESFYIAVRTFGGAHWSA